MSCPATNIIIDPDDKMMDITWMYVKMLAGIGIAAIVILFSYTLYRIFVKRDPFSNPGERLVLYTFIPILVEMVGKFKANTPWETGNLDMSLCRVQTSFITFGNTSSIFLSLLFAWDLWALTQLFRNLPLRINPDPHRMLTRRELFYVPLSLLAGALLAGFSVPFACPREFWCWVSGSLFNTLMFSYGWMCIAFFVSIATILFFVISYLWNQKQFNAASGILPGCLTAFTLILAINSCFWVITYANRFTNLFNGYTSNPILKLSQALISSAHGLLIFIAYVLLKYNEQFYEIHEQGLENIANIDVMMPRG